MLRPAETALIIVDMQNAYASPGGYLDLAGFDISGAAPAIEKISEAAAAARAAGMPVIFFQNGWDPDYVEAGGPGSPNWHKSNALKTMRSKPELQGKLLAKGGWDYELVAGAAAAARRHRRRQAALQRLLQHQARQPAARARHPLAGLHRHRHQCLRRIHPARRLLPRIFRRRAARRHAPRRARLHPEGLALQHREVLRLGVLGRRSSAARCRPTSIRC